MKIITNYKTYLLLSILNLCIGGVYSFLRIDMYTELLALIAFVTFVIAVGIVAFDEFIVVHPNAIQKIKSRLHVWKK